MLSIPTPPFISPEALKNNYPLKSEQRSFIYQSRATIRNILNGKDPRLLLILGPCSIHDLVGAKEYAERLKLLADEVSSSFFIVMRTYFEKPRTSLGWKGLIHDPYLDGSDQINQGYILARQFLLELAELQLPTACEFLDPITALYKMDLISWGCIGARTAASPLHRQLASSLPMPVAFKNSMEGNIEVAVNGCIFASKLHRFLALSEEGRLAVQETPGNPDCHLVLRGSEAKSNYDPFSIKITLNLLKSLSLPSRLLVDCSHGNCQKKHELQPAVFLSVLEQILLGNQGIKGLMLESYLEEGNQPFKTKIKDLKFGVSLTDPCINWETTLKLVRFAHQALKKTK